MNRKNSCKRAISRLHSTDNEMLQVLVMVFIETHSNASKLRELPKTLKGIL